MENMQVVPFILKVKEGYFNNFIEFKYCYSFLNENENYSKCPKEKFSFLKDGGWEITNDFIIPLEDVKVNYEGYQLNECFIYEKVAEIYYEKKLSYENLDLIEECMKKLGVIHYPKSLNQFIGKIWIKLRNNQLDYQEAQKKFDLISKYIVEFNEQFEKLEKDEFFIG